MKRLSAICECRDHGFVDLQPCFSALVSPEDLPAVSANLWRADRRKKLIYVMRMTGPHGGQRRLYLHRFIMGEQCARVDHINGDGLDNRRCNLRPTTASQNAGNARKKTKASSKFKGVSFNQRLSRWQAYVHMNGRRKHLGFFAAEADAARAYDAAAVVSFGDFAATNEKLGLLKGETA